MCTFVDQLFGSFFRGLALVFIISTFSIDANGQSDQYQLPRDGAKASSTKSSGANKPGAASVPSKKSLAPKGKNSANGKKANAAANPTSASDDEDLSKLENSYWQAKDTDFQVVQNRLYEKIQRFSVSASFGPLINDQFSTATVLNLNVNYYFSERFGIELSHLSMNPSNSKITTEFIDRFGVVPNFNKFKSFTGISANYVPIYAKASLIGKRILYFDLSFSFGIGQVQYTQQFTDKASEVQSTLGLSLEVVQQFFLTKHFALRASYSIKAFKEEVRDSRTPFDVRDDSISQNNVLLIGLTYFH